MIDSVFRRELLDWAKQLPKNVGLGLNDAHDRAELQGISYEMRRNLDVLASRSRVGNPLAILYLELRARAVEAKARDGNAPPYFHDSPYCRTAYRGDLKSESASMSAFIQPLGDALLEFCNQPESNEIGTPANQGERAAGNRTSNPVPRKRGRPPIPLEIKSRAWEARRKPGVSLRDVAKILYGIERPTERQVKNVPSILKHYGKSLQKKN